MYTDKDKKIRENPSYLCVSVCYLCLFWEEPVSSYEILLTRDAQKFYQARGG